VQSAWARTVSDPEYRIAPEPLPGRYSRLFMLPIGIAPLISKG
jgi:hypothetical protein